jgi:hypothetical protein
MTPDRVMNMRVGKNGRLFKRPKLRDPKTYQQYQSFRNECSFQTRYFSMGKEDCG